MPILSVFLLLTGLASLRAADFNTTLEFELGIWSTVLDFTHGHEDYDPWGGGWRYNETTETFDKWNLSDTTNLELQLVAAGYSINGDLQADPSVNGSTSVVLISHAIRQSDVNLQTSVSAAAPAVEENGIPQVDLGGMGHLTLNSYNSLVTFHDNMVAKVRSLNVTIPVRTQGSRIEEIQTQYTTVRSPGMARDKVNPGFGLRPMRSHSYFDLPWPVPNTTNYVPKDYGVDTVGWTEVTYKVPSNTTLVHALHDVGPNRSCYVVVNPSPPWFVEISSMPTVESTKLFNRSNQTMQLLPLDPEVEYQLVFGPWNENTTCSLSGVKSYSFYAIGNGPPNSSTSSVAMTPGAATSAAGTGRTADDAASPSPNPSSVHSKGVNVGAIVGGVVGGVGGAVLLILSGCLFIRRRRRKHEPVPDSDDDLEDMMSPGEEPHVITQFMLQPSIATPTLTGKEESMAHAESPTDPLLDTPVSRHGVQYAQDAEDVDPEDSGPTILPPRYKEAWGQRLARSAPRRVHQMLKAEDPTSPVRAHDGVNKP